MVTACLTSDKPGFIWSAGSVWTSPAETPDFTIHKYGTGSGSDRVNLGQAQANIATRSVVNRLPVATAPGSVFVRHSSNGNA